MQPLISLDNIECELVTILDNHLTLSNYRHLFSSVGPENQEGLLSGVPDKTSFQLSFDTSETAASCVNSYCDVSSIYLKSDTDRL